MSSKYIRTIPELRKAIKDCAEVRIMVRFGTNEGWYKLSKIEANAIIAKYKDTTTPEELDIYGRDNFGSMDGDTLYMG